MITDYTTYDRLRSVLALTSKELPDAQLDSSTHLEIMFLERLAELSENLASNYVVLTATAATATEVRFVSLMQVYATYFFAVVIADNLAALLQKQISDGRAQVQRFDYVEIQRTNLLKQLGAIERKIQALYLALFPTESFNLSDGSGVTLTVAVGLATDPVTGA